MKFKRESGWWSGAQHKPWPWQVEAMAEAVEALSADEPAAVVIQAVMGSGKSIVIAELIAQAKVPAGHVVVVTTTSQRLVEQLAATLAERGLRPGRFYARAKEASRKVIVACVDSAEKLAKHLKDGGRECLLWIADEAHRTECNTIHLAHEALTPGATLGVTATPFRSQLTEELSLFERCIYEYGPIRALEDGVIVRWRVEPWTGGQVIADEACLAMIREHGVGPGVVNASSIVDAETFASVLRADGLAAEAIHSKQTPDVQRERLKALRSGALRCLVHVSMLQEGVDLPWLRWLCLRRATSSRLRFAQEVGRVLRRDAGKTEGVILDPHDLFGEFKLDYDAVLCGGAKEGSSPGCIVARGPGGWWEPQREGLAAAMAGDGPVDPLLFGIGAGVQIVAHRPRRPSPSQVTEVLRIHPDRGILAPLAFPGEPVLFVRTSTVGLEPSDESAQALLGQPKESPDAVALGLASEYLRRTTIELEQLGKLERKVTSKSWRHNPRTAKQLRFIGHLLASISKRVARGDDLHMPARHREAMRFCAKVSGKMARGSASDLTDVLLAIVEHKQWPLQPRETE